MFLDDILIYSDTEELHKEHVEKVIKRLREYNLILKLSKFKFARHKLEYLSHIIVNGIIRPNPEETAVLANAKRPRTVKQVEAFERIVFFNFTIVVEQ